MPSVATVRPQNPVAPLNPAGQQALAELLHSQASRKRLAVTLTDAAKRLTEVAGQLNDRGTEQRLRHAKLKARLEANGEDMSEEERLKHDNFQAKVVLLTQKMDQGVRGVVDGQIWLDNVPEVLTSVARRTGALAEATHQQTQGPTPLVTQGNRLESDQDTDADAVEKTNAPLVPAPAPSEAPTALLRSAFKEHSSDWQSKSLTERYANSNEYTGFYRTVYDAKNPGEEAPPIPHASLWFAAEESPDRLPPSRSQARQSRQAEDEEDSDVEIASERVSLKCPITLLPFQDPLTSTKCPHSFERDAILDMLRLSSDFLPLTAEQELQLSQIRDRRALDRKRKEIGTPCVKCPVCSCPLVAEDLKPDPVLLRKVKRAEAATKRQENAASDSEEDKDEALGSTQRKPVGLGSSPATRTVSKVEMNRRETARSRSRIPQTQLPSSTPTTIIRGGATVVDLGDEDEEDDDQDVDEEMYDS